MPVMDGLESSRRIREWEKDGGFNTFIVALTASYLPEKGGELFAAGIDNYIAKPFKVEQIYRMVGYCTSGSSKSIPQQASLPSGETNNLEILDVQSGLQRMGGNLNIYTILLAEFLGELQERLELLQGCLKSDDFHGLARAAHNLKGVSASLGALQLSEYAKRLESHSNAGYTNPLPDLLAEIKASGYALKQAGQLFLSKSGSVFN
jgi:HPt (histidine-containing phosphotransfer) domain-containing protein